MFEDERGFIRLSYPRRERVTAWMAAGLILLVYLAGFFWPVIHVVLAGWMVLILMGFPLWLARGGK